MEEYLNPENIYIFPTKDGKVIKIVLEGPSLDIDLVPNIDEICATIRTNDIEALKHFIITHFK